MFAFPTHKLVETSASRPADCMAVHVGHGEIRRNFVLYTDQLELLEQ